LRFYLLVKPHISPHYFNSKVIVLLCYI